MIWHHVGTTNMSNSRQSCEVRKVGQLSAFILFIDCVLFKELNAFMLPFLGRKQSEKIYLEEVSRNLVVLKKKILLSKFEDLTGFTQ